MELDVSIYAEDGNYTVHYANLEDELEVVETFSDLDDALDAVEYALDYT